MKKFAATTKKTKKEHNKQQEYNFIQHLGTIKQSCECSIMATMYDDVKES
jgi:hypothetical protein